MTHTKSILRNSKKALIGILALTFVHTANAGFIDFFSSKQTVAVGETFTISLVLRDINQDLAASDYMVFADYNIHFREDLLDWFGQRSMPELGLQNFSYLSRQDPLGFGNLTKISTQLAALSNDQVLFDSQITNNADDFFTIDEITFVATNAGIANFESISRFASGNFSDFDQLITQFDVTITDTNVNVNAPSTAILMCVFSLAFGTRKLVSRKARRLSN
jgi:hypothetical protein